MSILKLRVWHLMMLVAATAALLAVLQFRQEVYDPTAARLRKMRYADAVDKAAAIRYLMAEEAYGPAVVETLFDALRDSDREVRALAAQAMADAICRSTPKRGLDAYVKPVKAALAEALKDRDEEVRVQAASGLSSLGGNVGGELCDPPAGGTNSRRGVADDRRH
jgi:hypothetical protein